MHVEIIEAEYVITLEQACELLSKHSKTVITPDTHWVMVTHEVTRDAKPWAMVRFQAIARK